MPCWELCLHSFVSQIQFQVGSLRGLLASIKLVSCCLNPTLAICLFGYVRTSICLLICRGKLLKPPSPCHHPQEKDDKYSGLREIQNLSERGDLHLILSQKERQNASVAQEPATQPPFGSPHTGPNSATSF